MDWVQTGSGRYESSGTGSTYLITVQSGAANTKGNWIVLLSSTSFDTEGFWFFCGFGTVTRFLIDIGVGSLNNEIVLVSNLLVGGGNGSVSCDMVWIPLSIPAGTRITARSQSATASANARCGVLMHESGWVKRQVFGRATTYGAETGDSTGISVDSGGTVNTEGSYAEITASTTNPIKELVVCIASNTSALASAHTLLDIAIGASLSETIVIPNISIRAEPAGDVKFPAFKSFAVSIPAGTRIAARAQSNSTNANSRLQDVVLIGFD